MKIISGLLFPRKYEKPHDTLMQTRRGGVKTLGGPWGAIFVWHAVERGEHRIYFLNLMTI